MHYTSWNDNFRADVLPKINRIEDSDKVGGFVFSEKDAVVSMEAEHFYSLNNAKEANWTVIPFMGRTLSGISLQPYSKSTDGATLSYKFNTISDVKELSVLIAVKSTLAFSRLEGHRYAVSLDGGEEQIINFNERLNEEPANQYSIYYPTVAKRVVESKLKFNVSKSAGEHTLTIRPIEPGTVFEKIVIDLGGYKPSYLFMDESPVIRE